MFSINFRPCGGAYRLSVRGLLGNLAPSLVQAAPAGPGERASSTRAGSPGVADADEINESSF
jgi:hypothetical protein